MEKNFFSQKISRRDFCKMCSAFIATVAVSPLLMDFLKKTAKAQSEGYGFIYKKEARFYEKIDARTVNYHLCPRHCRLKNTMRGFCRAREAQGGKLYSHTYANPTAVHVDPIEKKPLFHFLPGTKAFSIATAGCNLRCKNCQNWQISQFKPEETYNSYFPPEAVVDSAFRYECRTIAYTYTEPSIFYEYMLDTSLIAKKRGVKNIYHSNGTLNPAPVKKLCEVLDGANIDLKGFSQDFYSRITEGYLDTVLETITELHKNNVHLEITCLIIPTLNDDKKTIEQMCAWIKKEIGVKVPLHFSRFHPTYQLKNLPPTPVSTLEEAHRIAKGYDLQYVYIGNVPGHKFENTYCHNCNKLIIGRTGYVILENYVNKDGKCKFCGTEIPGVWD
jgi:pyruvate formate lyase activating enzyme